VSSSPYPGELPGEEGLNEGDGILRTRCLYGVWIGALCGTSYW